MNKRPVNMTDDEIRALPDYWKDISHPCKAMASIKSDDIALYELDGLVYTFIETEYGWTKRII